MNLMSDRRNEEWEQMKQEYENIPVPKAARERMEQGIRQARQERKVMDMKRWIRNTAVTAASALVILTAGVNASPAFASAMERVPVIGAITKVVTFRTYEDQTDHFEADIQVPKVEEPAAEQVNKSIEAYADELIAQYEAELKESNGEGNYSMSSSYEVVTDNARYVTIRIRTTIVMASGAESVKTFTVDKVTGEVVTLDQLFAQMPDYKQVLSDNIKKQMEEQMAADSNVIYFHNSEDPSMDFKEITGEESFYFNKNGELVIAFDEYTVAPGYMGAVEFTIPKDVTGDFMK